MGGRRRSDGEGGGVMGEGGGVIGGRRRSDRGKVEK